MNKKILIIPDVHGRTFWKSALRSGDYEKIVFLGDYTDPYEMEDITNREALKNFKSIIAFKQQNPEKVVLLLGNHDLHYYSEYYYELAGGVRYDPVSAVALQRLFTKYHSFFQLAWETDWGNKHYLFSHAGIMQSWLKRNVELIRKPDARHLNRLLHSNEGLESLAQVGEMRWGDYPSGSIVWADIDELLVSNPLSGIYQIVGHTMQFDGPIITDSLACLDCRASFTLNDTGGIELVTELTSYEDVITSFIS
jgi:hypothetical protein